MTGSGRRAAAIAACVVAMAAGATSSIAAASTGPDWRSARLPGLANMLYLLNVSCPSSALCVATGTQNVIASSTNPTGGAGAWDVVYAGEGSYKNPNGEPVISSRQIQGVSCPTTGLCVAVTTLGQIYTSTNPTGPAAAWHVTELPSKGGNTHLYGVSCPTASLCVTVSGRRANRGKIFTSNDPTGGAGAWQLADLGDEFDLRAVSCSSPSLCIVVGANGEVVVSTDPTGGRAAWSSIGSPGGPGLLQAVACVPGLCLTGNQGGNLLTATSPLNGSSWKQRYSGSSVQITGAACASQSACLALDNNGHVLTSTAPAGDGSAWRSTVLAPYSPEAEEYKPDNPNALFGASCPSASFCALVGSGGQIFTSTDPFATPPSPSSHNRGPRHGPRRPRVTVAKVDLPTRRGQTVRRARGFVRFYANGPVRRFECRIDHHRFHRCHSPKHFRVGIGVHPLRIHAIGTSGLRGPTSLTRIWLGERCSHGRRHGSCLTSWGSAPRGRSPRGQATQTPHLSAARSIRLAETQGQLQGAGDGLGVGSREGDRRPDRDVPAALQNRPRVPPSPDRQMVGALGAGEDRRVGDRAATE